MRVLLTIILLMTTTADIFPAIKESRPVGPGVIYHHEVLESGPWQVHVLEVDLSQQWIQIETVKANDQLRGSETTSAMAARNDREGHRVVGAVNADFFSSRGIPVGAQVINGVLLKRPTSRSAFVLTKQKHPVIDIVTFGGKVITPRGAVTAIDGINEARADDKLIVYNRYFGLRTQTNYWGTEIATEKLVPTAAVNDTILAVVFAKDSLISSGHGSNPIPFEGLVLSGHGKSADFLNRAIFVGDTLKILLQLPPIKSSVIELVGGTPRLIRNGKAKVEWTKEHTMQSFAFDRHPRTALGISQDSTKLYLFTVDGRQPGYSVGMSLFELADYMLDWGVYQGINFDGGGSTTMVVRGEVVNSPSDQAGERSVGNALMVISTAPTGAVAILRLEPNEVWTVPGQHILFRPIGMDEFYNPVTVLADSTHWKCQSQVGRVDEKGMLTVADELVSGYVLAQYGQVSDSAKVQVTKLSSVILAPNPMKLKIGQSREIHTKSVDESGHKIQLTASDYHWSITGGVGEISGTGRFKATQFGVGSIIATHRSVAGSTRVLVDFAPLIMIDDFSSTKNCGLTDNIIAPTQCQFTVDSSLYVSTPSSGRLNYKLRSNGACTLRCATPIIGAPIAVNLQVYGDGQGHWLRGEYQDEDGEKFWVDFTDSLTGISWKKTWQKLSVPIDNCTPNRQNSTATLDFPIRFTKFCLIDANSSENKTATIYFDDLTASYLRTETDQEQKIVVPANMGFKIEAPNCLHPSIQISISLQQVSNVNVMVYSVSADHFVTVLNRRLSAGIHHLDLNTSAFADGIYLCRIQAGEFQQTQKTVVMN